MRQRFSPAGYTGRADEKAVEGLRLGVLGSINRDTITSADGHASEGLGGVLYTACAAAHLGVGVSRVAAPWRSSTAIDVRLIARLGEDVRAAVLDLVEHTPKLTAEGFIEWPGPAYHCHIQYGADGGKLEALTGDLPPLTVEEIAPHLQDLDALLINFITGFELSLHSLAEIRRRMAGPILVDVHSLTLGRRAGGERFWRRPPDWRHWVRLADVVQLNQDEAAVLMNGERGAASPHPPAAALQSFARMLVAMGSGLAVITRGPLGVIAATGDPAGGIEDLQEAPPFVALPQGRGAHDPTGCGDVFLAGLGVATLAGLGGAAALRLANRAAAGNCEHSGLRELHRLAALS